MPLTFPYIKSLFKENDTHEEYEASKEELASYFLDGEPKLDTEKMLEVAKKNIKTIRLLCKYSVRKFAQVCHVCPQTVSNWENKDAFKQKNYWCTVISLLLEIKLNPPTGNCVKLVSYILFGYNDINYKENVEKIGIIAQAYKGGADQESIEMLCSALCLDPNACLNLTKDPTMPSLIKFMIQEQFKGEIKNNK
jgi:DNA-binding transcriptional regulator YiaG